MRVLFNENDAHAAVLLPFPEPLAWAPSAALMDAAHYLGRSARATLEYRDEYGLLLFGPPASRHIPTSWLELQRWCLMSEVASAGSRQWARVRSWLRENAPSTSTVVSYSDPSVGHDGALYRACGWLWAPTWMRLREPPSGGGTWSDGKRQAVKDRWVFPLRPDESRAQVLGIQDMSIVRRMPWAEYREPMWKRGRFTGGGGDYLRWRGHVIPLGAHP